MCEAWLISDLRLIRAGAAISSPAFFSRPFPYSAAALLLIALRCLLHFGTALPGRVLAKCSPASIAVPFIEEHFFAGSFWAFY